VSPGTSPVQPAAFAFVLNALLPTNTQRICRAAPTRGSFVPRSTTGLLSLASLGGASMCTLSVLRAFSPRVAGLRTTPRLRTLARRTGTLPAAAARAMPSLPCVALPSYRACITYCRTDARGDAFNRTPARLPAWRAATLRRLAGTCSRATSPAAACRPSVFAF